MRVALLVCLLASGSFAHGGTTSRLGLTFLKRLDTPQRVASASLTLTDFAGFIATSFKVPLLVETPSPVPDLTIPEGIYTAQQLLDLETSQLHGFAWREDAGVAHLYQAELLTWHGNVLNVRIHRYFFPHNVAEFLHDFPSCVFWTIRADGCQPALAGIVIAGLQHEALPYLHAFRDATAREILLKALQSNGRFYVFIAYESAHPNLKSEFPFENWFAASLVPNEPAPMWVQIPKRNGHAR